MAVAVHAEPHARWLSVPHYPQVGDAITGVKHVRRIDEKKPPVLIVLLLGDEGADRVHRTLYPSLEAGAQPHIAACVLCPGASNPQGALCQ